MQYKLAHILFIKAVLEISLKVYKICPKFVNFALKLFKYVLNLIVTIKVTHLDLKKSLFSYISLPHHLTNVFLSALFCCYVYIHAIDMFLTSTSIANILFPKFHLNCFIMEEKNDKYLCCQKVNSCKTQLFILTSKILL